MYKDIFISLLKASGKLEVNSLTGNVADNAPECKSATPRSLVPSRNNQEFAHSIQFKSQDDNNHNNHNNEILKLKGRRYIWRTVGDSKVRSRHAGLDGTVRVWGDGLNPGEDYNCRCYPEFVDEKLTEGVVLRSPRLSSKEWQQKWLKSKNGIRMSSPYGKRIDPLTGQKSFHKGDDYALPKGTPIPAVKNGFVAANRYQETGYGNYVRIVNNDGTYSDYAHMDDRSALKIKDKVSQGDIIGYVGSSGKSTGYHLHYTERDGKLVSSSYGNSHIEPSEESRQYLFDYYHK